MRPLRLLTLLLAAPLGAQAISVPATVDTLANGLTVIVHEDHSAPIVTVNTWYHVGSGSEKPGRTGFAHLFEHLMFMGSEHAEYPQFDRLLEAAGANNNGSTTEDRTNYYESGPRSALALMLWLDADRMGWLLPTMDSAKVDAQRDIVKNERRQSYENQPYGMVGDVMPTLMYPAGHPYSWTVIGSMADLSAASLEDVKEFFRTWYAPNNASIVIAGDVTRKDVLALVHKYFDAIPRGPAITYPTPSQPTLAKDTLVTLEDRVQLARLYYQFPTVRAWADDDAALEVAGQILSGSKNSRLTKRLQYDDQTAVFVYARPEAKKLAGDFGIVAQAKPGIALPVLQRAIDEELARLAADGPTAREMEQAHNSMESSFLSRIQTVGGKANQLNEYYYLTGTPDAFERDLDRLKAVTADDVKRVVTKYLLGPRAIVGVVPMGKTNLKAMPRVISGVN
ncbi:MAG TPA: pitrilysin family protein [Gemmatimonadales bacterium]|nr:pitrilysin family protein [Gemmatimonadales bacterium]